jgi:hypothetical protein
MRRGAQPCSQALSRADSASVSCLGSQSLNVSQILLSTAGAFIPDGKKSWKSRGSGIIRVCSLAQQFHSFKAFDHRLAAPKAYTTPAVVQVHHCDLAPIYASMSC